MLQDNEEQGKQQLILKAASRVFSEKGYHRATIDEIARRAEIGKGTVYAYFSSKEDLFNQVIQSGVEYYIRTLKRQLEKKGTVYDRLSWLYQYHLLMMSSQNDVKEILSNEIGKLPEQLKRWMCEKYEELLASLQTVIEQGIESGEVRRVNPRVAAHLVISGMKVLHKYNPVPGETLEGVAQEELRIIWEGLGPP